MYPSKVKDKEPVTNLGSMTSYFVGFDEHFCRSTSPGIPLLDSDTDSRDRLGTRLSVVGDRKVLLLVESGPRGEWMISVGSTMMYLITTQKRLETGVTSKSPVCLLAPSKFVIQHPTTDLFTWEGT